MYRFKIRILHLFPGRSALTSFPVITGQGEVLRYIRPGGLQNIKDIATGTIMSLQLYIMQGITFQRLEVTSGLKVLFTDAQNTGFPILTFFKNLTMKHWK